MYVHMLSSFNGPINLDLPAASVVWSSCGGPLALSVFSPSGRLPLFRLSRPCFHCVFPLFAFPDFPFRPPQGPKIAPGVLLASKPAHSIPLVPIPLPSAPLPFSRLCAPHHSPLFSLFLFVLSFFLVLKRFV